jgi:tetratricopeptide (TPR) repeat protein
VVIGLSIFESEPLNSQDPRAQKTFAPVVSAILTLSMLIVSVMFFKSEHGLYNQRDLHPPGNQQENAQFVKRITQPISMGFKEPAFAVVIALRLAQSGDIPLAIEELKSVISNDPRNYDALKLLSEISEFQKDWQPAISAREKIRSLDPYNAGNLLQLGVDYKKVGNQNGVKGIIPAINAIDPSSNEAKQALKDLG